MEENDVVWTFPRAARGVTVVASLVAAALALAAPIAGALDEAPDADATFDLLPEPEPTSVTDVTETVTQSPEPVLESETESVPEPVESVVEEAEETVEDVVDTVEDTIDPEPEPSQSPTPTPTPSPSPSPSPSPEPETGPADLPDANDPSDAGRDLLDVDAPDVDVPDVDAPDVDGLDVGDSKTVTLPDTAASVPALPSALDRDDAQHAGPQPPGCAPRFPVAGPARYGDDFGAPRPGGRQHEGNDIFAERGTPVIAADDGTITSLRTGTLLAGTSLQLTAADGTAVNPVSLLDRWHESPCGTAMSVDGGGATSLPFMGTPSAMTLFRFMARPGTAVAPPAVAAPEAADPSSVPPGVTASDATSWAQAGRGAGLVGVLAIAVLVALLHAAPALTAPQSPHRSGR